jgi:hypothetical protein
MAEMGMSDADYSGVTRRYTWRAPRWLPAALILGVIAAWGAGIWWGVSHMGSLTGTGSTEAAAESALADEAAVLRARVEYLTQQSNTLTAERDALAKRVTALEARPATVVVTPMVMPAASAPDEGVAPVVEPMTTSLPETDLTADYSSGRFAVAGWAPPTPTATAGAAATGAVVPATPSATVRFFTNGADRYNCTSFTSQAEAQEALAANAPGDPNRMDMNANGVACEDIAYPPTAPRNLTPIPNR